MGAGDAIHVVTQPPRVSVVVAAREPPDTTEQTLLSLARQIQASEIEVLVVDGSDNGKMGVLVQRCPGFRYIALPGGNLPALKAEAIRQARGEFVAVLDPSDAAAPNWVGEILAAFVNASVWAVGGSVLLSRPKTAGNIAAYLFEYGAFNPPIANGETLGDLPGNNVAYRRSALIDSCADILASEGFNKPFFHERIRACGGQLIIRASMRVDHLTDYSLLDFGVRRFHYGRCFGAVRARRAPLARKILYRVFAPVVVPMLIVRHLHRNVRHAENRRLLSVAVFSLCAICIFWGVGEWLGCWFGAGRSCQELY
jgi:glycosyltransferase involved in cell wall biosynthesis